MASQNSGATPERMDDAGAEGQQPYVGPLYVQSEFDLRPGVPVVSCALVQSDPLLGQPPEVSYAKMVEDDKADVQQLIQASCSSLDMPTPKLESTDSPFIVEDAITSESIADNVPMNSNKASPAREKSSSSRGRVRNQSEMEINAQHYRMQNQYKNPRKRRLTDIDFEGILKIIGGCNMWQIIIYLMISAHQVPHAMFNLSVVYFTYQPDHWCKIPSFSREYIEDPGNNIGEGWTWEKALDSGIAFQWSEISRGEAEFGMSNPRGELVRCKQWDYDTSVMRDSVVTQWHLSCDDNWSRAHVHLSYSLGYLVGCMIGGYISDRYGRKPAIYGFSILSTIFGFLLPFSREFEVFLIVRFLLAVCNEAADLAAYVFCMEITGMQYRSIVGSLLQAPWACGYAFLALVAYTLKSWVSIQMVTSVLHLFALFLIHYLPESPRWLIVMNKVDEAEKLFGKPAILTK
uniref:Major facilitator superfamily (MFS) profile domain-containing protein n=1 Tax=Ditylenchus dipsaci TaxID=166011 RepID=A0A915D7Q0_9BILA